MLHPSHMEYLKKPGQSTGFGQGSFAVMFSISPIDTWRWSIALTQICHGQVQQVEYPWVFSSICNCGIMVVCSSYSFIQLLSVS